MNKNIDLTKILKNCPKGTKLYSLVHEDVLFEGIVDRVYPIEVSSKNYGIITLSEKGRMIIEVGECILFPSRDQRDWSKFTAPWYNKERFDPRTLKPFDKVIVRLHQGIWCCELFSFIEKNSNLIKCCGAYYAQCVPYNDETKHLVGTTGEAPEYYKYWED